MKDTFIIVRQSAAFNTDYFTINDNDDYKKTHKENKNYKRREPPSPAIKNLSDAMGVSSIQH